MARFLAIDWDQNQLHIAEANISGSTVKVLRAAVTQEEQAPLSANPEALGKLLRERLKAAGIAPAPILACVGRDRTIQKDLRFPSVPEHEEPALVRFQAMKELSESPDDVVIDFISARDGIDKGETRALALIVRRDVLDTYQKICAAAGVKLAGLTPRPIGLSACLRRVMGTTTLTPAPEPPDAAVAIVTVADKWAEFCVVRGKSILFSRHMTAGPNLPADVRRNLAVFAGQNAQLPVRAIYLAGDNIAAVRDKLTDNVDFPIYSFDPFAGAERPELPINHRGSFAGAVGLCYARSEKGGLPINFVSPRQPRPPENPNKRRYMAAAVLALVAVVGLFFVSQIAQARKTDEVLGIEAEKEALNNRVIADREELTRLKKLDDWEGVVWLDELYEMAENIGDVNALRVTTITLEQLVRGPKQKYAAKVTIKGYQSDRVSGGHAAMDKFMDALRKDGHYNPQSLKWTGGYNFTLVVEVEKRAPADYKSLIKEKI